MNRIRTPPSDASPLDAIIQVLGGKAAWGNVPRTLLEVHEAIETGIRWRVLYMTYMNNVDLDRKSLLHAIGISLRTAQRMEKSLDGTLPVNQGGRLWKLGEILVKTQEVMGSPEEAVKWLHAPSMGLNQRSPLSLLTTPVGIDMVETLLQRMEYGVYS